MINQHTFKYILFTGVCSTFLAAAAAAQQEINISAEGAISGWAAPVPVSVSGFSGEVDAVLKQDLMFNGMITPCSGRHPRRTAAPPARAC